MRESGQQAEGPWATPYSQVHSPLYERVVWFRLLKVMEIASATKHAPLKLDTGFNNMSLGIFDWLMGKPLLGYFMSWHYKIKK